MPKMIQLFSKGIEFASTRDAYELDYGLVEVPFGRVSTRFLVYPCSATGNQPSGFITVQLIRKGMFYVYKFFPGVWNARS